MRNPILYKNDMIDHRSLPLRTDRGSGKCKHTLGDVLPEPPAIFITGFQHGVEALRHEPADVGSMDIDELAGERPALLLGGHMLVGRKVRAAQPCPLRCFCAAFFAATGDLRAAGLAGAAFTGAFFVGAFLAGAFSPGLRPSPIFIAIARRASE